MINFRYHVVSLTAVFLALAIGLVVGTAALNGPVADSLKDRVNALGKDNKQLRDHVDLLTEEVNDKEAFAREAAWIMLDGTLDGRRVLLVTLPSGRDHVEGVTKMLTTAGARLSGRVEMKDKFANPESGLELLDLVDQVLPASVPAGVLPSNSEGVETASALLGAVLLDRTPAVTQADRKAVLTAFSEGGYLSVEEEVAGPAEAIVVIAGVPYVDSDNTAKNAAVVTMAVEFDKAGVVTVAGNGVGQGNVVTEIRGDPALTKTISTVDNVPTVQGQLVTVLALADQLRYNKVAHYGLGAGATSLLPKQPE